MSEREEPDADGGDAEALSAWLSTVQTYEAAARLLDRRLDAEGLSIAKFDALAAISRLGKASQQAVADRMLVSKAGTATMLSRLERDGLVKREPDPDDARARRVSLTRKGAGALRRALRCQAEVVEQSVARLSRRDQRSLRNVMDSLGAHVAYASEAELSQPDSPGTRR